MVVHVQPASVEIAAPPERVREVLLDFRTLPSWHQQHFKSISLLSKSEDATGLDLVHGDKLKVVMSSGISFSPVVVENTPSTLKWRGSIPLLFTGDHVFEFQHSRTTPGGTTFVQYEGFSGLLAFTMAEGTSAGKKTLVGFQALNEDLKRRVEQPST